LSIFLTGEKNMIEHMWFEEGVVRWLIGEITTSHYVMSNLQLQAEIRFQAARYVIDDFSDCTRLVDWELLSPELASEVAEGVQLYRRRLQHAVVAPDAPLRERAFRMARKEFGMPVARKFSSMKKARNWTLIQWHDVGEQAHRIVLPTCGRQLVRSGMVC
jgi:hypothetical protein